MFTRAGLLTAGIRAICRAKVSMTGQGGRTWAILIAWPGGDWAWASSSRICWGDQVQVHDLIEGARAARWGPSWPMDPRHGAQHWIEKGVAPSADQWQARAKLRDQN